MVFFFDGWHIPICIFIQTGGNQKLQSSGLWSLLQLWENIWHTENVIFTGKGGKMSQ